MNDKFKNARVALEKRNFYLEKRIKEIESKIERIVSIRESETPINENELSLAITDLVRVGLTKKNISLVKTNQENEIEKIKDTFKTLTDLMENLLNEFSEEDFEENEACKDAMNYFKSEHLKGR